MSTTSAAVPARPGVARAHRVLAITFIALAAVVQFFLAGLIAFGESDARDAHAGIGSLLIVVALVLVVLAVVGRREALPASAVLLGLIILQSILGAAGEEVTFLGGLHPLNGLLILGTAGLAINGRPIGPPHGRRAG